MYYATTPRLADPFYGMRTLLSEGKRVFQQLGMPTSAGENLYLPVTESSVRSPRPREIFIMQRPQFPISKNVINIISCSNKKWEQ